MRDEDKTREQLLAELVSLREELLQLRCAPGGQSKRPDPETFVGKTTGHSTVKPHGEKGDFGDFDLPTIDEVGGAPEFPRFLNAHKAGVAETTDQDGGFTRDMTESGSFDLRWLRLASFAKLLEAIPLPILMVDLAGVIRFANKAFLNLAKDDNRILGSCIYSFFPEPEETRQAEQLLANVLLRRKPEFREGRLAIEGCEIWCRMSFRSIRFGTERSIMVLIEDLTRQKRELTLNEKFKKLVTVFPVGIAEFALPRPVSCTLSMEDVFPLIVDARVTGANIEFARLYGLETVDELKGTRLQDVFPVEVKDRHLVRAWVNNRLTASSLESKETGTQGEPRFFENTLVGVIQDNHLVEFWGVREDITERKLVHEELLEKIRIIDELYEHVLQAGKAKVIAEHTGKVAHELRQPLAIIGGFTRRLAKETASGEKMDEPGLNESFQIIIKEVERLEHILRGLIEFTDRGPIHLEKVNPNSVIQYVLKINAERFVEKNISVQTNLGEETGEIFADTEGFEQVVRNLLATAVDASSPGELIQIETGVSIPSEKAHEVGMLESDAYFEMKIQNRGKVIPPDELQKIFNPFVTTKDYGTGIGLTLAKKIIEDHNGSISVKSDEEGTLFTVWLPLNPRRT